MIYEYNESRDSFHVPKDAGEYTDGLIAILMRIPDGWGRWISCDRGWYSIIIDIDQKLAKLDPNYTVHQVKEKFGGLCYYFEATEAVDHKTREKMQQIVVEASTKAAETCEICGSTKKVALRDHGWWKTVCDQCDRFTSSS